MRIKVNGENVDLEAALNLVQLLKFYRLKTEMVVIELNREVPNKVDYASTLLKEGDAVEIVKFLGGG
jgi:sulfur carrier protein